MAGIVRRLTTLIILGLICASGLDNRTGVLPARAGGIGPLTTTLAYPEPPLLASAAAVLDVDTGQWLRLYNADTPLPMASTTKIMTALLALQHGHLQDIVRVSAEAATIGESSMGLVAGERVSMHDLLYGLLLPSGNDAAIAIAEHISGNVPKFVALMNATAVKLHLTHTHYTTPYGFSMTLTGDEPDHHTSARDLIVLSKVAMQYSLFRQIVATHHYLVPKTALHRRHDLQTVDYFINWYPGADGVKPGWTSGAGVCQVIDVHRDGRHLLAAILHTANVFTDARDLMNYALGDFTWAPSGYAGDTPDQMVAGGTKGAPEWYFPLTGHSIQGAFLTYFRAHGGYAAFGAPQTEAVDVDGTVEQYFTGQVLVNVGAVRAVRAQRLGFSALPAPDWLRRVPQLKNTDSTRYYTLTGHTVTNRFLQFYLRFGGPATFGYPISEKRELGGTLVQYFENAELIWHPQPDDYHGYVSIAPLGVRCLVAEGLMIGHDLPPALHPPYYTSTPSPTVAPAGPTSTATPKAPLDRTPQPAVTSTPRASSTPRGVATPTSVPVTSTPMLITPAPTWTASRTSTAAATATPGTNVPTHTPTTTPTGTASSTKTTSPTATPFSGTASLTPTPAAEASAAVDTPVPPVEG